ncbi:MAG: hypothetical protein RLZZ227_212 [Pseudomonadota bacterium]|jgi:RNA polymerase-binding transcription factor DksA
MNLTQARERLLVAKAETEARLERTRKHLHRAEALSPNSHERSVETANDDVVDALDADAHDDLQQIDRALARVADGSYLNCSKCSRAIAEQRLVALPWTKRCIDCA